jgi:hypothetical protein
MPIQTFSAKVGSKLPIFYKLMQELSKSNDELTFVVHSDKLVIKTTTTSTLSIIVTLYRKLFDSFPSIPRESPKMYTIFSTSIRDIFSKGTMDLSSLRIIIEESENLSEEDLVIFEVCRKMRSIQSKHNIFCNSISHKLSEINEVLKPLNEDPSSEENHWSINSEDLKGCWPQNCKNDTIRFVFNQENLRIINLSTSDDEFVSESRFILPTKPDNYFINNPVDIRINRKSFERVMHLICSLKCNLNAHFSDMDSEDVYQPQPFYLCGEIERYIKVEGKISGSHMEYGNQPVQPNWEIESALNASNQIDQTTNSSNEMEYPIDGIFLQEIDTEESSSSYITADENYMPVGGNANTRNSMIYTYDNNVNSNLNPFNVNGININNVDNREIPNISNSQVDNINNIHNYNIGESSSFVSVSASDSSLTPGEDISRRLESVRFGDNQVNGMKRSFSATDLSDDTDNDKPRSIRSLRIFSQD